MNAIANLQRIMPHAAYTAMMNDASQSVQSSPDVLANVRWCPHDPHPKQKLFIDDMETREILFGGAAGGGKTDALLAAALTHVNVPNYSAIIFRRSFPQLNAADGLIDRSRQWLANTPASYNKGGHRWTWPNNATLTFAHMQYDDDVFNHQGAAYQFIGWEELTHFTKRQYTYLYSRNRRPMVTELDDNINAALAMVPLRIRATANPGGRGHTWVKSRFIDINDETRAAIADGRRRFIKSLLADNPSLDAESYIEGLMELDPVTRAQLLRGEWEINDEGLLTWDMIAAVHDDDALWVDGVPPTDKSLDLYIGVDIGRTSHNTVIWVWELIGDVAWCRVCRVLNHAERPVPFAEQRRIIEQYIKLPGVVKCHTDKGGIGYQITEELESKFPHIVEGIQLNAGRQGQLGQLMATRFGDRAVRIPNDDDLNDDLQLVERTHTKNGMPTLKTDEGPSGHADRFWAGALGLSAMPLIVKKVVRGVPRGVKTKQSAKGRK